MKAAEDAPLYRPLTGVVFGGGGAVLAPNPVGSMDVLTDTARQDCAEDFCRLKVQRYTAHGLVLIPAYCFARP